MKTEQCLDLLDTLASAASIPVAEGTPLYRCSGIVLTMARAYGSDGRNFLSGGDPVNALAGAWYGSGWLHFGIAYGLLAVDLPVGCPFISPCEPVHSSSHDRLVEKTGRYERLLKTARESVTCGGEPSTPIRDFSGRVLFIAALYSSQGGSYRRAGSDEDALACFSYGHGWLDAAVSAGLFSITGNRDLFTV